MTSVTDITVEDLVKLSINGRRENSSKRFERYVRARDEAFDILTDGVVERVKLAATKGDFRYEIYSWHNKPRGESSEDSEESRPQLIFGKDENGENGLHVMTLVQPTNLEYADTLMAKLRDFFKNQFTSTDETIEDSQKKNFIKVFLHRDPANPRACSLVVSWDRFKTDQLPRRPFNGYSGQAGHAGGSGYRTGENVRPTSVERTTSYGERQQNFGGLRHPVRGINPVRGAFRGRGRGRGASISRQ